MGQPSGGTIKHLRAAAALKQLMTSYYKELEEASQSGGAKVAWCTSVGPVELLRACGFRVYFPENHAALLGASRRATALIPAANAVGYSPEVCSYLTSDIGAYLAEQTALSEAYGLSALPKPDLLVFNTNQCREVQDWMAFYQRAFQVPLLGIETPRAVREVTHAIEDGLVAQYRGLVPALCAISGARFDVDRLREVVASSHRCTLLWEQALRTAAARPAPWTFFDATIHMGPAVLLRGDERAERYYELLGEELEERRSHRIAAVESERYRLYWEGMPIWGKLREHAELFSHLQASVVASTYCNSWVFRAFEERDPFVGMARAYTELFIARAEAYKERYLTRMLGEYHVDAVIYHDAKTCPHNSNNRYGLPARLRQALDLPYVVLCGDLNDLRLYSDEQARTQLEALIEQLAERPA